jgi:hypothetical protein
VGSEAKGEARCEDLRRFRFLFFDFVVVTAERW